MNQTDNGAVYEWNSCILRKPAETLSDRDQLSVPFCSNQAVIKIKNKLINKIKNAGKKGKCSTVIIKLHDC